MTQDSIVSSDSSDSNRPLSILYVEDHADTLSVVGQLFERHGYQIHLANSVNAALRLQQSLGHLDVLITDLELPDGNGIDLLLELLKRWPVLCAIALTGYGMKLDIDRTNAAGFNRHIVKPVAFDEVVLAISDVTASACR